ncbi:MAG: hypothetical protein PF689_00805 [Deltaproteobacteria bacterium]|jgi:hypothetical protein|nr:hypothetical protein [Deltaproteobacteria bacterium]
MKKLCIFLPLIIIGFLPQSVAANKWKQLKTTPKKMERADLGKEIKKDLGNDYKKLLKSNFVLKLVILGGGGPNKLSETVLFLKKQPSQVYASAKSNLRKRSAVTLSGYNNCKWDGDKKQHYCPKAGIARVGSVDVTDVFKNKRVLLVSRARTKYKAKTVIWLGSDTDLPPTYYLQFNKKQFGLDHISAQMYQVLPDKKPELPPNPEDLKDPFVTKSEKSPEKPEKTVKPVAENNNDKNKLTKPKAVVTSDEKNKTQESPPVENKITEPGFKTIKVRAFGSLKGWFKKDYLQSVVNKQNREYYWIRISISDLDSQDYGSFQAKFPARPQKIFVYAWTDRRSEELTSMGFQCKGSSLGGCPYKLDGERWYNLSGMIKAGKFELRSFPEKEKAGKAIIWLGFMKSVKNFKYNYKGKIKIKAVVPLTAVRFHNRRPKFPRKAPEGSAKKIFGRRSGLGGRNITKMVPGIIKATRGSLSQDLRQTGVDPKRSGLLNYRHVYKIVVNTSYAQKASFDMKLPAQPGLVLAKSFGRGYGKKMVQLGKPSLCKGTKWCPYHIHSLNWSLLNSTFKNQKTSVLIKNRRRLVKRLIYWIGFKNKPPKNRLLFKNQKGKITIKSTYYLVSQLDRPDF